MNKSSGGDGIPVELFQILKDDAVKVLHSICQQIWKTQQWPQDWKRSVFIPNPKERQCQRMLKLPHNWTHLITCWQSNAQNSPARLQQYVNCELSDVQVGFREGKGTRDQIANIHWIIKKAREFQKNTYFCFTDYTKAFDCVDHNRLWKILGDWNTRPPICLLRSLYAGQEATVRTRHGTTDCFQTGKGVRQGCTLSPCLFNLYVGDKS